MIERRPYDQLRREGAGRLKARHHFPAQEVNGSSQWGCLRAWADEEIAPNAGFGLETHVNVEIITYVREGTLTHRDGLGNEGLIDAGSVQIVSAGVGIRHAEYNLDQVPASIFQIWLEPVSQGGPPAWAMQPCTSAERAGCVVVIASGSESDHDALPIRACARVLNVKLKSGQSIEHVLTGSKLAYLVPSSGTIDVNGVRIFARDGTAIKDVTSVRIAAIEDADIVLVDGLLASAT